MNDSGPAGVPHPPYDDLRAALGAGHEATDSIDALQTELQSSAPDPATITEHASRLRGVGVLEARVANWWDDPVTQSWVKAITDAGA